jgi:hypothetical protein
VTDPGVDATTGRVTLTRPELAALVERAAGREVAPAMAERLTAAGAIVDGGLHPAAELVARTVAAARARAAVRRWGGGAGPVAEVLVGPAGVAVLPGGPDPGTVQDVRWHPRPSAVARLVAELLGVTAEDGPPVAGAAPQPWSELVTLASRRDTGIGLADLRWADDRRRPLATLLVVAWHRDGGVAEVVPADPAESAAGGLVRCVPRHPLEVWTGLTALAVRAARASGSRRGRG